jgi:ADP-ribosylglycohydrolase
MINLRDKVFGCYIGAAVGDALGGPVQAMHADRIQMLWGGINDMVPYRKPPCFFELGPGYALHGEPGSVTDETLIRAQFANFATEHPRSRTAIELVTHLLRYGDLNVWPPRMVESLNRVKRGLTTPETAGQSQEPGGGLGWWTPVGIANAGRPEKAVSEATRLSALWKRPLEQDLIAAVQAGIAHALTAKATPESVVATARSVVGPLARNLIDRAAAAAREIPRGEIPAFTARLYEAALVESVSDALDGPMPLPATLPQSLDVPTSSPLLAEQVPLAFAALLFGDGRSRLTLCAAASLGRDAKAIGSTVGSLIGALVGRSRLPREWVGAVIAANHAEVDLVQQANDLADFVEPKIPDEV